MTEAKTSLKRTLIGKVVVVLSITSLALVTVSIISFVSCVSKQMGNASMPANCLNKAHLPSITGKAASGPIFPRPRTGWQRAWCKRPRWSKSLHGLHVSTLENGSQL